MRFNVIRVFIILDFSSYFSFNGKIRNPEFKRLRQLYSMDIFLEPTLILVSVSYLLGHCIQFQKMFTISEHDVEWMFK